MASKYLYKYTISCDFSIHFMLNKMAENCIFNIFNRIIPFRMKIPEQLQLLKALSAQ